MTGHVLQALRRRCNHHGLVIVREGVLLDELRISADALRTAVRNLEEERLVEVLSPLPFLVLKWSGKRPAGSKNGPRNGLADESCYSSYSFNNNSIDKSIAIKAIGDSDSADGEGLLQEILTTLGESDPTTFRRVLTHYPAKSIRAVLERVRSTPTENLRKSKTALFRYLLARTKKSPASP